MQRRAYGSGSIRERPAGSGKWQLRVRSGTDPLTDKPRYLTETYHGTKKDAQKRLSQLVATVDQDRRSAATVAEAIEIWRRNTVHAPGTARNYDLAVSTLPPGLLRIEIADLRASTIRDLVAMVVDKHGPHRARLVHAVVSGACRYAHEHEWAPTNPARLVPPPPAPKRKDTTPDSEHVRLLLAAAADDVQFLAWLRLAVVTGSRRSEVLALRWRDIDLTHGKVFISGALDPILGSMKSTKTGDRRIVSLDPATVEVVARWRKVCEDRAKDSGGELTGDAFVVSFDAKSEVPWRPDQATKRFAGYRKQAGIPAAVRLHDLRHYMATTILAAGIDPKTASARAGHSRVATTTDLYASALPARDEAAARALAAALRGDKRVTKRRRSTTFRRTTK